MAYYKSTEFGSECADSADLGDGGFMFNADENSSENNSNEYDFNSPDAKQQRSLGKKGFATIKQRRYNSKGGKFNEYIKVFPTGQAGSYIVDAISGEKYKFKVGTAKEYMFFKVMVATGFVTKKGGVAKTTTTLFFETPDDYRSHFKTDIDPKVIKNWENNYSRSGMKFEARAPRLTSGSLKDNEEN
jgi:hypothetical protein